MISASRARGFANIDSQALNRTEAARYIGVGYSTICLYIQKGILKPFYLPAPTGSKPIARIRLEDLDRFVYTESTNQQYTLFNPRTIHELPACVTARLLGISEAGVWVALRNGCLKDRTPESIRRYQIKQISRRVSGWVRNRAPGK